jgi:pimeloyl-ACP methyl ester carboxylesterase
MTATRWAANDSPAELVQQAEAALAKLETSLSLSMLDEQEEPPKTRVLTLRDGRQLAYTEWGSPDGAPIVFQHGMPGSRFLRAAAHELYQSVEVRVITPDRPGYGLSDAKPHYGLVDWPSDVVELADYLQIDRFGVVSLSGGGLYALACAALTPDRLLSVVTTDCPAPLDRPGALTGMHFFNRAVLRIEETMPWLLEGGASLVGGLLETHTAWFLDKEIRGGPPVDQQVQWTPWVRQSLMEAIHESARNPQGYDDDLRILTRPWGFGLERIRIPVHVWHGDLDSVIPLHHARYLASVIPAATLTICPGEAHMLLWNHVPEIVTIARSFPGLSL